MEEEAKGQSPAPAKKGPIDYLKKIYHFLWKEESLLSYAVFIVVAFLLLRFVAFPGLLLVTGYSDIAAVVSTSMQHSDVTNHTFNGWLSFNEFSEEEVASWSYLDGLGLGDVVAVKAVPAEEIGPGDIVLFYSSRGQVIHRVVYVNQVGDDYFYTTKGDANPQVSSIETDIPYDGIKGKLVARIPYLGYPRVVLSWLIPFI